MFNTQRNDPITMDELLDVSLKEGIAIEITACANRNETFLLRVRYAGAWKKHITGCTYSDERLRHRNMRYRLNCMIKEVMDFVESEGSYGYNKRELI